MFGDISTSVTGNNTEIRKALWQQEKAEIAAAKAVIASAREDIKLAKEAAKQKIVAYLEKVKAVSMARAGRNEAYKKRIADRLNKLTASSVDKV